MGIVTLLQNLVYLVTETATAEWLTTDAGQAWVNLSHHLITI